MRLADVSSPSPDSTDTGAAIWGLPSGLPVITTVSSVRAGSDVLAEVVASGGVCA
jgi:hypothetical protein